MRPRVGIPAFKVSGKEAKAEMTAVAADQMSTLLIQAGRFKVIERSQLEKLLEEVQHGDMIAEGEGTEGGNIRGVDYLMIGVVSNLSATVSKTNNNSGGMFRFLPGKMGGALRNTSLDLSQVTITTACGVDLRLVSPETGEAVAAEFSQFNQTVSASALGVDFRGYKADSDAELKVSEDDYGKILRLALDDAVRKMLPKIDQYLLREHGAPQS